MKIRKISKRRILMKIRKISKGRTVGKSKKNPRKMMWREVVRQQRKV